MEYVRKVDEAAVAAAAPNDGFSSGCSTTTSGSTHCSINCIRTPAGGGSPAGMHTHVVDQIFYILSGTMSLEIEGKEYEAGPARWWSSRRACRTATGTAARATVHLAFNAPLPDPACRSPSPSG